MSKTIISFEEGWKNYFSKEPSLILAQLFPRLNRPKQSRFQKLFEEESKSLIFPPKSLTPPFEKKPSKKSKKNKKHNMDLNLIKILNGTDKRTSLMVKNIPSSIPEFLVIKWLSSLANLNYIYVPKDEQLNKILGFAFINVCKYTDILNLIQNIKKFQVANFGDKKIEVCYSHKQGYKLLTKSFGVSSML